MEISMSGLTPPLKLRLDLGFPMSPLCLFLKITEETWFEEAYPSLENLLSQ